MNKFNLFKIKDYYVVMYYVVDKGVNNDLYRNTKKKFYYFNHDTAFFANKGCEHMDTTFQYFRYPAVFSDLEFIYHSPRVMNCISKSNEVKTLINSPIDTIHSNYLSIKIDDQYQISKLKKYRFSTDYNKEIIGSGNYIYLLKEYAHEIFYQNNVRNYNRKIKVVKFDKDLNITSNYYINNNSYSVSYMKNNRLYLFNFKTNKCLIYEV